MNLEVLWGLALIPVVIVIVIIDNYFGWLIALLTFIVIAAICFALLLYFLRKRESQVENLTMVLDGIGNISAKASLYLK